MGQDTSSPEQTPGQGGEEGNEREESEVKGFTEEDMNEYFHSSFPVIVSPQVFELKEEVTQIRRYFHSNPELTFQERSTSANVAKYLKKLKLEVTENVGGYGVVGLLQGANPGPCILLRADMDALPVTEKVDVPFKSRKEGVMHACGHDCHMAILLGAARVLSKLRKYMHGSIKFCFQPAEEGGNGAELMIKDGVLENPHVDQVYGLHVWSYEKFGKVVCRPGPLMAGAGAFNITVRGKGGHGAVPQDARDPVVAAANLVLQLHTIVARNISPLEPAVVTVGKLATGSAFNVIPEVATIEGTHRWMTDEVQEMLERRIREVCQGIEVSFGVEVELQFRPSTPSTVNHVENTNKVRAAALQVLPEGVQAGPMTMAGEDFAFFLRERPGSFFFVSCGVDADEVFAHHKPDFQVDERCLPVGCQIMVTLALDILLPQSRSRSPRPDQMVGNGSAPVSKGAAETEEKDEDAEENTDTSAVRVEKPEDDDTQT